MIAKLVSYGSTKPDTTSIYNSVKAKMATSVVIREPAKGCEHNRISPSHTLTGFTPPRIALESPAHPLTVTARN